MNRFAAYESVLAQGSPALYSLMVLLGAVAGGRLILRDSRAWPLVGSERRDIFLCAAAGGLAGCALPASFAGEFVQWQAMRYPVSPKTILGGMLFSFASVALYKRLAAVRFDTSDAFARGTALMMAVGRLGCWAGHCCFGIPVRSWGVDLGDGIKRFPVQLLEAASLFLLFGLLSVLHRNGWLAGRRLFLLFAGYGTLRFFLEYLREPLARVDGGLGFYQWLALALTAVGLYQLVRRSLGPVWSPVGRGIEEAAP